MKNNIIYWDEALKMAEKAYKLGEIPVGAILVKENKIISKGFNSREKRYDILGHAEINAIKKATKRLKTWKLNGCDLYVTLKPCSMCESIIKQARIDNVYYLVEKKVEKVEYYKTNFKKVNEEKLSLEYKELLSSFFKKLR